MSGLKDPKALNGNNAIQSAVADAESTLGKEGRVLVEAVWNRTIGKSYG